jgi:hypothetical protein
MAASSSSTVIGKLTEACYVVISPYAAQDTYKMKLFWNLLSQNKQLVVNTQQLTQQLMTDARCVDAAAS